MRNLVRKVQDLSRFPFAQLLFRRFESNHLPFVCESLEERQMLNGSTEIDGYGLVVPDGPPALAASLMETVLADRHELTYNVWRPELSSNILSYGGPQPAQHWSNYELADSSGPTDPTYFINGGANDSIGSARVLHVETTTSEEAGVNTEITHSNVSTIVFLREDGELGDEIDESEFDSLIPDDEPSNPDESRNYVGVHVYNRFQYDRFADGSYSVTTEYEVDLVYHWAGTETVSASATTEASNTSFKLSGDFEFEGQHQLGGDLAGAFEISGSGTALGSQEHESSIGTDILDGYLYLSSIFSEDRTDNLTEGYGYTGEGDLLGSEFSRDQASLIETESSPIFFLSYSFSGTSGDSSYQGSGGLLVDNSFTADQLLVRSVDLVQADNGHSTLRETATLTKNISAQNNYYIEEHEALLTTPDASEFSFYRLETFKDHEFNQFEFQDELTLGFGDSVVSTVEAIEATTADENHRGSTESMIHNTVGNYDDGEGSIYKLETKDTFDADTKTAKGSTHYKRQVHDLARPQNDQVVEYTGRSQFVDASVSHRSDEQHRKLDLDAISFRVFDEGYFDNEEYAYDYLSDETTTSDLAELRTETRQFDGDGVTVDVTRLGASGSQVVDGAGETSESYFRDAFIEGDVGIVFETFGPTGGAGNGGGPQDGGGAPPDPEPLSEGNGIGLISIQSDKSANFVTDGSSSSNWQQRFNTKINGGASVVLNEPLQQHDTVHTIAQEAGALLDGPGVSTVRQGDPYTFLDEADVYVVSGQSTNTASSNYSTEYQDPTFSWSLHENVVIEDESGASTEYDFRETLEGIPMYANLQEEDSQDFSSHYTADGLQFEYTDSETRTAISEANYDNPEDLRRYLHSDSGTGSVRTLEITTEAGANYFTHNNTEIDRWTYEKSGTVVFVPSDGSVVGGIGPGGIDDSPTAGFEPEYTDVEFVSASEVTSQGESTSGFSLEATDDRTYTNFITQAGIVNGFSNRFDAFDETSEANWDYFNRQELTTDEFGSTSTDELMGSSYRFSTLTTEGTLDWDILTEAGGDEFESAGTSNYAATLGDVESFLSYLGTINVTLDAEGNALSASGLHRYEKSENGQALANSATDITKGIEFDTTRDSGDNFDAITIEIHTPYVDSGELYIDVETENSNNVDGWLVWTCSCDKQHEPPIEGPSGGSSGESSYDFKTGGSWFLHPDNGGYGSYGFGQYNDEFAMPSVSASSSILSGDIADQDVAGGFKAPQQDSESLLDLLQSGDFWDGVGQGLVDGVEGDYNTIKGIGYAFNWFYWGTLEAITGYDSKLLAESYGSDFDPSYGDAVVTKAAVGLIQANHLYHEHKDEIAERLRVYYDAIINENPQSQSVLGQDLNKLKQVAVHVAIVIASELEGLSDEQKGRIVGVITYELVKLGAVTALTASAGTSAAASATAANITTKLGRIAGVPRAIFDKVLAKLDDVVFKTPTGRVASEVVDSLTDFTNRSGFKFDKYEGEAANAFRKYQDAAEAKKGIVIGHDLDPIEEAYDGWQALRIKGEDWTEAINMSWVDGAVDAGRPVLVATPIDKIRRGSVTWKELTRVIERGGTLVFER